jgi:hypothetical protein
MRRGTTGLVALALLIGTPAIGIAIAKGKPEPTIVRAGNMVLELNGDVTPRALPEHELAPMGFWASGKLATIDGSHPPALERAEFDSDKDVVVGVKGLPTCRIGELQARETKRAEAACGDAILGRGSATVEVAFPEQKPFDSTGPLLLFNGGERSGVIDLLVYTYVSVPAPTAVIATARLNRVDKGAFGLHTTVEVPRIAGGSGSIIAANISVRRVYTFEGRRRSVISGRCPDGRILGRGRFSYSDGSVLSGSLLRTCTVSR